MIRDDNNRLIAFNVLIISLAILAAIFMVHGCVEKDNKYEADARIECIRRGGEWQLATGLSSTFTCKPRNG